MKKDQEYHYQKHIGKMVECVKGKYKGCRFVIVGYKDKKFICRMTGGDFEPMEMFSFKANDLREIIERMYYEKLELK